MNDEHHIDHEVRIRILEDIASKIDKRFDSIELKIESRMNQIDSKLDSRFLLLIGLILTSIIIPVILPLLKIG